LIPLLSAFAAKSGGFLSHGMEHGENLFVFIMQFFVNLVINIVASKGEFEPGLGFGGFLAGFS
jgi:hypothetical protein